MATMFADNWPERVQSWIIGFVFAYMVWKLFSVISSFRAENLQVTLAPEEEGPSGIVELAPLSGTEEEVEADGGDEQEDRPRDSSSSSDTSDSEAEGDNAPASRPREIGSTDELTVSEGENSKKDDEVEEVKHDA